MGVDKVKIVDGFWLDLSKVSAMFLDDQPRPKLVDNSKDSFTLFHVFRVIAHVDSKEYVLLTDETSGVKDKCEKFILENWVNRK